jgi:L-lactate dehydrogenase complex protein LldF
MVTEEIGLNEALEGAGMQVTETDLGEWIIQLAGEHPSHIIAPAVHKNRDQVADTFEARAGMTERVTEPTELVAFARRALRRRFLGKLFCERFRGFRGGFSFRFVLFVGHFSIR